MPRLEGESSNTSIIVGTVVAVVAIIVVIMALELAGVTSFLGLFM